MLQTLDQLIQMANQAVTAGTAGAAASAAALAEPAAPSAEIQVREVDIQALQSANRPPIEHTNGLTVAVPVLPQVAVQRQDSVECAQLATTHKVVLFGPSGCGKTALLGALNRQVFDPIGWPTTMVSSKLFAYQAAAEAPFALQVWDCAGDARSDSSLMPSYFRGARAVVLCYAVQQPDSLALLAPFVADAVWRTSVVAPPPLLFLLGCKADGPRAVPCDVAAAFARENGLLNLGECSARADVQVDQVFCAIAHFVSTPAR